MKWFYHHPVRLIEFKPAVIIAFSHTQPCIFMTYFHKRIPSFHDMKQSQQYHWISNHETKNLEMIISLPQGDLCHRTR